MSVDDGRPWRQLLPEINGKLPSGKLIPRTDAGGSPTASIMILGVYPAARVAQVTVQGIRMNLPAQVERESFEQGVSSSGQELDRLYLQPLQLTRDDVFVADLMPYFLANTRGTSGRTMWDRIEQFEQLTGEQLGIRPRPPPPKLVEQARAMPGNLARLAEYAQTCSPSLLLTLGLEPTAFIRDEPLTAVQRRAREVLYQAAERRDVLGVSASVVHLAHPGLLMSKGERTKSWRESHQEWIQGAGSRLVRQALDDRVGQLDR